MKYISLFAGIGGFDLALNRLGHECVYANEWDKYAAQTYYKNFRPSPEMESTYYQEVAEWQEIKEGLRESQNKTNEKTNNTTRTENGTNKQYTDWRTERQLAVIDTRDITTVPTFEIPQHDLLVGGFPCQSFSIAGKRKGFDDTRGTLFFDIARILKDKRPRHFILENVKGLLSHDEGKTFQTILGVLSDLGYDYQWQVLNSKNFGVPQNRERVFIVGHIRGEPRPKVFPIGQNDKVSSERQGQISPTITQRYYKQGQSDPYIAVEKPNGLKQLRGGSQGMRVYDTKGTSTTIAGLAGGWGAKIGLYAFPTNTKKGYAEADEGDGINLSFPNSKTRRGRVIKGNSPTLQTSGAGAIGTIRNMKIRRLTPMECERLQGFPDNWTEGVSDTQRYKQLGNAVTVNVVYEVAKRL